MKTMWRDIENWLIFCGLLIVLVVMVISFFTTPITPVPVTVEYGAGARPGVSGVYFSTAPAMEWRVTDATGETYTYPEAAGWACVSGGTQGAAFRVECRRMADGREAERVELVAVRLERAPAGDGAE